MNELSRREKKALKDAQADLAAAVEVPAVRRLLRRLLDVSGVFEPAGDNTERHEGRRSVGLWLIRELTEVDVHAFPQMMQEAANDAVAKNARGTDDEHARD